MRRGSQSTSLQQVKVELKKRISERFSLFCVFNTKVFPIINFCHINHERYGSSCWTKSGAISHLVTSDPIDLCTAHMLITAWSRKCLSSVVAPIRVGCILPVR